MSLIPSRHPWRRRVIIVEHDLTCVQCQYNLRGLPLSGKCPECGEGIWDALLRAKYDVFRESMLRARRGCVALGIWPVLVVATMAVGQRTKYFAPESLIAAMACAMGLLLGGPVWATMPLLELRPSRQSARQAKVIVASLVFAVPVIALGAAGCGAVADGLGVNVSVVWDLLVFMVACEYVLLLEAPGRMLVILGSEELWRVMQTARVAYAVLAAGCLVSAGFQMKYPDAAIGEGLRWVAGLMGVGMLGLMMAAGGTFRGRVR